MKDTSTPMDQTIGKFLLKADTPNAPSSTNGAVIAMDLSTTVEHIQNENLTVVGADGSMNLRLSVARAMWSKAGSPSVPVAVTPAHVLAARKSIGGHYLRFSVLTVFTHSSIAGDIRFRKSDTVSELVWSAVPEAVRSGFERAADNVHLAIDEDANLAAEFLPSGAFGSMCMIANAIHREQVKGHNWFSDTTTRSNSVGGKTLAIAGAEVDLFSDFMVEFGHDLWHLIADTCLPAMAASMTGHQEAVLTVGIEHAGADYAVGTPVSAIFKMDEAAKDRYPPSQLGRAAAILGQRVIKYAVIDLMTRAPAELEACKAVVQALDTYAEIVNSDNFTRAHAQVVKKVMGKTFAFCYGYAMCFADAMETYEKNPSLKAWADQENGEVIIGTNVGKWAKTKDKDDNVIGGMIKTLLESMAAAFATLNDEFDLGDDGGNEGAGGQ